MADAFSLRIGHPQDYTPNGGANTYGIDAANKSLEHPFLAETSQPITRLFVPAATITGTPPTYRVSLQGLDGSGFADGVTKAIGTAFATFTPTAAAQWVNLGASYTPARGEALALVLSYESGTVNASNNAAFVRSYGGSSNPHLQYSVANVGGSRSKFGGAPVIAAHGTAGQAFGFPLSGHGQANYATAELAGRFTIPAGWGQSVQVLGVMPFMNAPGGTTVTCSVYPGGGAADTTPAAVQTADGDWTVAGADRGWLILFTNPITVACGSTFRVGLSGSGGSPTIRFVDVLTAADMDALTFGSNLTWSQRSGGNWTDTPTRRPCMQLILGDLTPGSGAGALAPADFNGGIYG